MSYGRIRILSLLTLSMACVGLTAIALPFARAAAEPVSSGSQASGASTNVGGILSGVSATSATNAWAVGSRGSGKFQTTVTMRWNGTRWSKVASPNPGAFGSYLSAVTATSRTSAWAVGGYRSSRFGSGHALILHWNGTRWSKMATPLGNANSELTAVSAISGTSARAVGWYATSHGNSTLILHWNGTRWSKEPSPNNPLADGNYLTAVSAASRTSAWAVGVCFPHSGSRNLLVHWNGTRWSNVPVLSARAGSHLSGVSTISGTSAWAVGWNYTSGPSRTLILHWDGTRWARRASPSPGPDGNYVNAVSAGSRTSAWAVGRYGATPDVFRTLILRWNGTRWSRVASPSPGTSQNGTYGLYGVSATSVANAWAVGGYYVGGRPRMLILHWNGTRWSRT